MMKMILFITVLAMILGAFILILALVTNQHEDEEVYLESFVEQCATTESNYYLCLRELDMLKFKISSERIKELEEKIKYKFGRFNEEP